MQKSRHMDQQKYIHRMYDHEIIKSSNKNANKALCSKKRKLYVYPQKIFSIYI